MPTRSKTAQHKTPATSSLPPIDFIALPRPGLPAFVQFKNGQKIILQKSDPRISAIISQLRAILTPTSPQSEKTGKEKNKRTAHKARPSSAVSLSTK